MNFCDAGLQCETNCDYKLAGEKCTHSKECASEICYQNTCVGEPIRFRYLNAGEACYENRQCLSNNCDTNGICVGDPIKYHGETCNLSAECISGICGSGTCQGGYFEDDKCLKTCLKSYGTECTEDYECISGSCSSTDGTCTKHGKDEVCDTDDQCASGACYGHWTTPADKRCAASYGEQCDMVTGRVTNTNRYCYEHYLVYENNYRIPYYANPSCETNICNPYTNQCDLNNPGSLGALCNTDNDCHKDGNLTCVSGICGGPQYVHSGGDRTDLFGKATLSCHYNCEDWDDDSKWCKLDWETN